jgi:hypothetical protein
MTNPQTLTRRTCLEICQLYLPNEKCGVCFEPLSPVGQDLQDSRELAPSTGRVSDNEIVKTKVCGDAHFFHRICIMSWLTSTNQGFNECPLDRNILYGTERIPQPMFNLPSFVQFPDHDVAGHAEFYEAEATNSTIVLNQTGGWRDSDWASYRWRVSGSYDHIVRPTVQLAQVHEAENGRTHTSQAPLHRSAVSNLQREDVSELRTWAEERREDRFQRGRERANEPSFHRWIVTAVETASVEDGAVKHVDCPVNALYGFVAGRPERRFQAIAAVQAALDEHARIARIQCEVEVLDEVQANESALPRSELANLFDGTEETVEEVSDEAIDDHDADRERWACQ